MIFVFASMASGIASGLRVHLAAVLGTALFCGTVYVLTKAEFGSQKKFDGLLRFQLSVAVDEEQVIALLRRHTRYFVLVSLREAGQGKLLERAYQVQLADQTQRDPLVNDLRGLAGIQGVSLLLQEPTVEI
jgi:uncharacterized membrane protein YhiD involved in acid resistance